MRIIPVSVMIAIIQFISLYCSSNTDKITDEKPPVPVAQYLDTRHDSSLVFSWDPPAENLDSVASYEFSYRTETNPAYSIPISIPISPKPSVTLKRNDLPQTDSLFIFRIRSVMKSGTKSSYQYSYDTDAVPAGGWSLLWPAVP